MTGPSRRSDYGPGFRPPGGDARRGEHAGPSQDSAGAQRPWFRDEPGHDDRPWYRQEPESLDRDGYEPNYGPPRRGRAAHVVPGQTGGFGRLLGLTVMGAVLPGSGLVAANRRRIGWFILFFVLMAAGALAAIVLTGSATDVAVRVAENPHGLRAVAGAFIIAGALWAVIIVASHMALREGGRLNIAQQVASIAVVCALVAVAVASSGQLALRSLDSENLFKSVFKGGADQQLNAGAERVNVLLVGSDAGGGRVGVRPDTLITASINTKTGDVVLLSLPRNLQNVPFPVGTPGAKAWPNGFNCGDECLLNAIWQWGEQHASSFPGDDNPGLTATRHAVSGALGLRLDYYAMVNLEGFEDVVDAMGGVTLNVPRDLPIGGGKDQITGQQNPITGYVPKGVHKLDGENALWYARSRADSDDFDRMGRQRCLLGAVADQANPRKLALAFPKLAAAASKNISTDISRGEIDAWVNLALRVKQKGQIRSLSFNNEIISTADPDFREMHSLVQNALEPETEGRGASPKNSSSPGSASPTVTTPPTAVSVRVLNGTETSGLAARAAADLTAQGFRVVDISNSNGTVERTTVAHDPGYDESGRTLAAAVTGADLVPTPRLGNVLTLTIGPDYSGIRAVRVKPGGGAGTPETIVTPKAKGKKAPVACS